MDKFERLIRDLTACDIGATFNLFRHEVRGLDAEGGAAQRRTNLLRYLRARSSSEIIAVGEAPGYRGARWSGIAFTSERTLESWGMRNAWSSVEPNGWAEPSATIVHSAFEELKELGAEDRILLWNTVPTHPHRAGNYLSNRRPRKAERDQGMVFARRLIDILDPKFVVAIGRVAESSLKGQIPYDVHYVRHPANAGARRFKNGMKRLLR